MVSLKINLLVEKKNWEECKKNPLAFIKNKIQLLRNRIMLPLAKLFYNWNSFKCLTSLLYTAKTVEHLEDKKIELLQQDLSKIKKELDDELKNTSRY
ncbi:hypothetical protein KY342_00045 [Candidatus Woesearchaeota archaeon]|nr:hypothetical protein [Candidatus Woesearchaeota archaeon]